MEVVSYKKPKSWDDKGMTWTSSMDPTCFDYAVALREAIYERFSIVNYFDCNNFSLEKYAPIDYSFFSTVASCLKTITSYFVNIEYDDYKEDLSDAPKRYTWEDLNMISACRICELPSIGCPATELIQWMIHAKNYINKLTVILPSLTKYMGNILLFQTQSASQTWGEGGQLGFLGIAKEAIKLVMKEYKESTPRTVYGSYIFGVREDVRCNPTITGKILYAATPWLCNTRIEIDRERLRVFPNVSFDNLAFIKTHIPKQSIDTQKNYVQKSVYKEGGFDLPMGITIKKFYESIDLKSNYIPLNTLKPILKSHDRPYPVTISGMLGSVTILFDFGVQGGFKFRP